MYAILSGDHNFAKEVRREVKVTVAHGAGTLCLSTLRKDLFHVP